MRVIITLLVALAIVTLATITNITKELDIRTIQRQYPACNWSAGAPYIISNQGE